MDFMILNKCYQKLKNFISFSLFLIIVIFINVNYLKFRVSLNFLNNLITIVSIVYGFLISSICNMFGRKITEKMNRIKSLNNPVISQLQEVKSDYKSISVVCLLLLLFSLIAYVVGTSNLEFLDEYDLIVLIISGIYLSLIFFLFIGMFCLTLMLLNFLINEQNI